MSDRLLHMIAPSSLSAFSASVTNGVLGAFGPSPVQPVRARASGAPSGGTQTLSAPNGAAAPPNVPPGQTLPRGSLLNLSV